jgi:hypothetical protein
MSWKDDSESYFGCHSLNQMRSIYVWTGIIDAVKAQGLKIYTEISQHT